MKQESMHKIFPLFFFICLLLSNSGCSKILMKAGGYKTPRIESRNSILDFCSDENIADNNIYIFKHNFYEDSLSGRKYPVIKKILAFTPGYCIFDSMGNILIMEKAKSCADPVVFDFSDIIHRGELSRTFRDSNRTKVYLGEFIAPFININGEIPDISDIMDKNYNYYIAILWMKWAPRKIRELRNGIEVLNQSKLDLQYNVLYLNIDYRDEWSGKEGKKIRMRTKTNFKDRTK